MKDNVKAWDNDPKLKARFVKEAVNHQKADRFIQGAWLQGKETEKQRVFKGCWLGCMTQTEENTIEVASEIMHLPLWLLSVGEKIFEGLTKEESLKFPVQIMKAIPEGMDSEKAYKEWHYRLLMDPKNGQITFTEKGSEQYNAIKQCAELFKMEEISESAARSAESAAWSAASAAVSAAESAESAESAAESAESARSAYYSWMKQLLIDIVKNS